MYLCGMTNQTMPVLFVGHGSPMNAMEDNQFSAGWTEISKKIPTPKGDPVYLGSLVHPWAAGEQQSQTETDL
jgi:hypothetical protein